MDELRTTPYERRFHQRATDLLFFSKRVNTHLDWQDSPHWLTEEKGIVRLVWSGEALVGFMAASKPIDGISWLRLSVVADYHSAKAILMHNWRVLKQVLQTMCCHTVKVLAVEAWLLEYLPGLGFSFYEDIITLERKAQPLPVYTPASVVIQSTEMADIESIISVDSAAFAPMWRMESDEIRRSVRLVSIATVARLGTTVVGHQMSTIHDQDAHLARLAVVPQMQGKGVGSALLDDLIRRLNQRGITPLTVNTQRSNQRSLRVYERYGFVPNGHYLPVWTIKIQDKL